MTLRDRVVVGVLLALFVAIAGGITLPELGRTAAAPSPSAAGQTAAPPATPAPPGPPRAIREGVVGTPETINPLLATSRVDQALSALVFSGLMRLGPGQDVQPDLASGWTTSDDGRVWTFELRADARWHDGEPVTAGDVVFTVGLLRDPAWSGIGAGSWRDVAATAEGDQVVRFELQTPIGGFEQLATQPILPRHLLGDVSLERLAAHSFNLAPVGSGRYRLESLDPSAALLVPADDTSAEATAPDLELRFYPDGAALMAAFRSRRVDLASGLAPDEARRLAATPDARLLRYPTSTLTAVVFNLRPARPEFRDPRVRNALLAAINRPDVVTEAWGGQAAAAEAPIASVSWAFAPAANPAVPYDPAAARRTLVDAGWEATDDGLVAPDGSEPFAFELLTPDVASNTPTFLAGAAIAADWKELGLDVTAIGLPPNLLVNDHLRTGDFAAAVLDINVGLDPDLYPLLGSTQGTSRGSNLSGLVDPELDELLAAARAPGTVDERRTAYRALQVRLAERQYLLPIAFRDEIVVARDTVEGPGIRQVGGPGDRFWDVLSWRLADDR